MMSLCPLRYLVALVITTSAPCSRAEIHRAGEGRVHQQREPEFLAIPAIGARSSTRMVGLTGDSMKMARVFFLIDLRQIRGSSGPHR